MKKVAFHTLGCKVNQVETEQMIEDFSRQGYQIVEFDDPADVYVINTCTVTHISDRKSRAVLRRAVRTNPHALIVATGCAAQVKPDQLAELEGISLIIGNQNKDRLVEIVVNHLAGQSHQRKIWIEPFAPATGLRPVLYTNPHQRTRAFVKIQDGCQSFCSYCIVPMARGPLRSKAPGDVMAEIKQLIRLGYHEIVLTGIHTGFYGADLAGWNLTRLLDTILTRVSGNYRLRLSSIEPLELNDRLLALLAEEVRMCRHLHIPLQSGSDRILHSMGRSYDREYYRRLVLKAAALIPGTAITADVMVGYPTETEADFQDTYGLIEELPIYELHVFKYSPRAGTPAAELNPQVEALSKQERSSRMLALGAGKKQNFIESFIGQELEVLVERQLNEGTYLGISDNYIEVELSSTLDLRGQIVPLSVIAAGNNLAYSRFEPAQA